ncbi:hypothetical protein PANA5342_4069 [Pantoea ananatis LMG 5342]|nr:hypothetical protein PANA5342_4069 [Pantoea ananatis LMG 5342]
MFTDETVKIVFVEFAHYLFSSVVETSLPIHFVN